MLTLNKIRPHRPCEDGWAKLLAHLGKTRADDEPLSLAVVLDSNGLNDALWCLRALDGMDGPIRGLACDFAERALRHVPEGEDRPRRAIEVARRYARGEATAEELRTAREAAWAAGAAWAAREAAWAARAAAREAAWAAGAAARAAAGVAAWAAAEAAAEAAAWGAAEAAAEAAAWGAAEAAERKAQTKIFRAWIEKHGL